MKESFLSIICVFLLTTCAFASKAGDVKSGNRMFTKGDYGSAANHYEQALKKDPESPVLNFNVGTAYYKKDDYQKAINHLQKALLSDDEKLREKIYYNLGNTFYKIGMGKEKQDINVAISALEQSLGQYENALKIDRKDEDAQYNYEIVKKELERLKKQKESQKQPNQSQRESSPEQQSAGKSKKAEAKKEESSTPQDNNQEENQNQEQKKSGNMENSSGDSGEESPASQYQNHDAAQAGEMAQEEAEQLLKGYQQSEEPKGLLNFIRGQRKEEPVLKDW